MSNICIIPARGQSQRIPRKNVRAFMGNPIIWYSIEKARACGLFEEVYVTTDSPEIMKLSMDHGAKWIARPKEMAIDSVGTRDVIRFTANQLGLKNTDNVCCIYATAPMMSTEDIATGYMYLSTLQVAHAISIGYPPLRDAAQFYWSRVEALRDNIEYFGPATALVTVKPERICDINTMDDWRTAEKMYKKLMEMNRPKMRIVK